MFKVCMLENSLYLMLRVSQRLNNEYKPCTCTFGMSSIKQIYLFSKKSLLGTCKCKQDYHNCKIFLSFCRTHHHYCYLYSKKCSFRPGRILQSDVVGVGTF